MSREGHQTCPHCHALVQSSICRICGKSAFEEIVAPAARDPEKWWRNLENNELRKIGVTIASLAVIAGLLVYVLTRTPAPPIATELPPPAPTTEAPRDLTPESQAPSISDGVIRGPVVTPGAPREVGGGRSPWQTAPPIDFITGLLLDVDLDFTLDIERVGELLAAFPESWTLDPLDPAELTTFAGAVPVESVETTQPFGARTIVRAEDGLRVGELWLVASAGTEAGDGYLVAARDRWDLDSALDQYSPEVGVRLWRLGGDDSINIWASDLDDRSMVVIQAPVAVDPAVVTDAFQAWRRSLPGE